LARALLPTRLSTVYFLRGEPTVFADVIFSTDGTPDDYSAYTFTAYRKSSAESGEYIDLTVDDSESDEGHIVVTATGAQTTGMSRLGVWDVQGAIGSGEPTTLIAGNSVMVPDVTR
jgi:hypothetical protein